MLTVFGNTDDDTHFFSGSVEIRHTGSATALYVSSSAIRVVGDITASRMIIGTSDMTGIGGPYGNLYVKSDESSHAITLEDNDGNETYNIGVADSGQFQIDAAVQPGNSGGPIFNLRGQLVGVSVEMFLKEVWKK